MVLLQRFRFYFVFCIFVVLSTFGLLSVYKRCVVRHLVTTFYLYGGDSDKQDRFDQLKISNYGRQYVEELELQIFESLFFQIYTLYADLLFY